jgi:hypothetical protein
MPRLKRSDKRKHEVTIELRCVLANMQAYGGRTVEEAAEPWERFWGGPAAGRAAFDALRGRLGDRDGERYEAWLERLVAEAAERDPRRADDVEDDEGAEPWKA